MIDEERLFMMLGRIEEGVSNLKSGQVELFKRMNHIDTEGCSRGQNNRERIEKLENRPKSSALVGSAFAAFVFTVAKGVEMWVQSKIRGGP